MFFMVAIPFIYSLLINSTIISNPPFKASVAQASPAVNVWWPTDQKVVTGLTPFKAELPGTDVSQYQMYWQVDGGNQVAMYNAYTDYPHKEAMVDLTSWNWHGTGPYVLTFTTKDWNGNQLSQQKVTIYTGNPAPVTPKATAPAPAPVLTVTPSPAPVTVAPAPVVTTPTPTVITPAPVASSLYVDKNSEAAKQAVTWQSSRPADAAIMASVAQQPVAGWFGDWNTNIQNDVSAYVSAAAAQNQTAVMVAYNIPQRDCGSYSAGGANGGNAYKQWIQSFANGIGNKKAVVVLEPDSLAGMDCLSGADQSTRISLLQNAVRVLKANANTKVYLDGGNANWQSADTMAARLSQAGIASADGFSLNVSNFIANDQTIQFGTALSQKIGGKHFVIDTSRNGNGSNGQWCNPSGRALGVTPTTSTGNALVDAFLWIKNPGESDGTCNGGPNAGVWWPENLLTMTKNKQ